MDRTARCRLSHHLGYNKRTRTVLPPSKYVIRGMTVGDDFWFEEATCRYPASYYCWF